MDEQLWTSLRDRFLTKEVKWSLKTYAYFNLLFRVPLLIDKNPRRACWISLSNLAILSLTD